MSHHQQQHAHHQAHHQAHHHKFREHHEHVHSRKHSKAHRNEGCAVATGVHPDHIPHWSYEGENGPANWGNLHPSFVVAKDGKEQSPTNISTHHTEQNPTLNDISTFYVSHPATIINNGHTVQVNWMAGFFEMNGEHWNLVQFHFHTPSEHMIDGVQYPLEMHLVHKNNAGDKLAVIGIVFAEGDENPFLKQFIDELPLKEAAEHEEPAKLKNELDPEHLHLTKNNYFEYKGSLTTPPCTEGVLWFVEKEKKRASPEQLEKIKSAFPKNARPVQPINERKIEYKTRKN